jgi:hypothetical protein
MSKVPIEIVIVGNNNLGEVPSAITLANAAQDEFCFIIAPDDIVSRMQMHAYDHVLASDFLDQVESVRAEVRGYHPFIISVIDSHLDGKQYSNLFGDNRADKGIAVITSAQVTDDIIPKERMAAYFVYYFARYALSFFSPNQLNHEDSRGCVFDRKVNKIDIIKSMRPRAFCDECRRFLVSENGVLSASQFSALEHLFSMAGQALNKGLDVDGRPRIFIGSSTEGLNIAYKLRDLLSDEFSVVVWKENVAFGLGTSTFEALEAAVLEFNNAIFIFTPDDEIYKRGEFKPVARDNVLFELGMFIGKLGRKKAFIVNPGNNCVSLPTDLISITTAQYDLLESDLAAALGPVASSLRAAIRDV